MARADGRVGARRARRHDPAAARPRRSTPIARSWRCSSRGEPLPAALDALARSIEDASGGARVAVLLARGADLELAAAPSLRADAAAALTRLPGGAQPGTFPDAGALSGPLAAAAGEHGLGFGWAAPVFDGEVPRALMLLFPGSKRFPSAHEQDALDAAVPLAQVAVSSTDLRGAADHAVRVDALTGVLSRAAFLEDLQHLARRSREVLGVLLAEVEGLQAVNRAAGYDAGDVVLRSVAGRLAGSVRGRDIVGRFSGTRFAVGGHRARPSASFPQFAQRLRAPSSTSRCPPVTGCSWFGAVSPPRPAAAGSADPIALLLEAEQSLAESDGGGALDGPDGTAERPDRPDIRNVVAVRRSGSGRNDR